MVASNAKFKLSVPHKGITWKSERSLAGKGPWSQLYAVIWCAHSRSTTIYSVVPHVPRPFNVFVYR